MSKPNIATFFAEVLTTDPDSKFEVRVSMFKHLQSGGIFGIDSSFLTENFADEEEVIVNDPFDGQRKVMLTGL
jgi:hypothetical protein